MALGWGNVAGKIFDWLPGRKESKEGKIERLINENAKLANEEPLSDRTVDRIQRNLSDIKRLRAEVSRIE